MHTNKLKHLYLPKEVPEHYETTAVCVPASKPVVPAAGTLRYYPTFGKKCVCSSSKIEIFIMNFLPIAAVQGEFQESPTTCTNNVGYIIFRLKQTKTSSQQMRMTGQPLTTYTQELPSHQIFKYVPFFHQEFFPEQKKCV